MSEEVTLLDLDWDLIQHLVIPESFQKLRSEQFKGDLIEDELAEKVWDFQVEHHKKHGEIATAAVVEDQFDEVTIDKHEAAIGDLIERLRVRYVRNQGQSIVQKLGNATVKDPLTVGKLMAVEGRHLIALTEPRGESLSEMDHDIAIQAYDERVIQGKGPSLGFPELDEHFYGQQGVTVVVAAPKSYKSWVTVNAVSANIYFDEMPYLYSLELKAVETDWRLKCLRADIPYWKYLRAQLDEEDRKDLQAVANELEETGNYRIEKPPPGERGVHQLVERAMNAEATCIFVDQLQYVEDSRGRSLGSLNDTGSYFEVLNDFRNYSDDIPIWIVHQFNRSVMGADEMPEPQQGKGSAAIEEVASLELGLWANKDMRASNVLQIGTLESRHYSHQTWEIGIELTRGCNFMMNGPVDE
jgi:hypothetical protein